MYSQASRFDVQRKLSAPRGGLIKKTKFEYFSGAQNSCFGDCGKCTNKWIIDFFRTFFIPCDC